MFDNIGGKIKTLAQVVCWIGIITSIIYGIVLMGTDDDLIFLGFIVMVVGALLSWVSSFTLFGFGEIIEDTKLIRKVLVGDNLPSDIQNASEKNNFEVDKTTQRANNPQIMALQKQYENGDITEDDYWKQLENLLKQQ